jgi:peptide deformylase
MALRNIRTEDDPVLRKKARNIDEINDRIRTLKTDMLETMYYAKGIGLAANQVGILRRIIVLDVGEGPIVMINPIIVDEQGCQIDFEGCLSLPEDSGKVSRPDKVRVEYMNMDSEPQVLEGDGLLARAICHEVDHLNGILFTDRVIEEDDEEQDEVDGEDDIVYFHDPEENPEAPEGTNP